MGDDERAPRGGRWSDDEATRVDANVRRRQAAPRPADPSQPGGGATEETTVDEELTLDSSLPPDRPSETQRIELDKVERRALPFKKRGERRQPAPPIADESTVTETGVTHSPKGPALPFTDAGPSSLHAPPASRPEPPASSYPPPASHPEPPASSHPPPASHPAPPASSYPPPASHPAPPASSYPPPASHPEPPASSYPPPAHPSLPPASSYPPPATPAAEHPLATSVWSHEVTFNRDDLPSALAPSANVEIAVPGADPLLRNVVLGAVALMAIGVAVAWAW